MVLAAVARDYTSVRRQIDCTCVGSVRLANVVDSPGIEIVQVVAGSRYGGHVLYTARFCAYVHINGSGVSKHWMDYAKKNAVFAVVIPNGCYGNGHGNRKKVEDGKNKKKQTL